MTNEAILKKVREELGDLDERSEQFMATLNKVLQGLREKPRPDPSEERFTSTNITPEEYEALPLENKRRYIADAEEANKPWIENQLNRLNAKWMMVVDGKVVLHGATLDTYPEDEDFSALCDKTHKYPFAFISPRIFAIEERPADWHKTNEPDDAYPALSIVVQSRNKQLETIADLDTGAPDCYCALELLTANGIAKAQPKDVEYVSRHLSRPFNYVIKPLSLELISETGSSRKWRTAVICVADWHNSPFIAINPNRTFLMGRGVLLNLRPRITLDFNRRLTEVSFPEKLPA